MFKVIFITIFFISLVYSDSDCDSVKCPRVPKHYSEIGCKPVKENDECCPSRFECPDKDSYALDKCYWNGNTYNVQERIPTNETSGICSASCFCAEGYPEGQPAEFRCAQIECGHFFNPKLKACFKQASLNTCCPKYLCDEEERKTVGTAKCELDGQTYRAGEPIYPDSEKCYKCICGENFDNSTIIDNPMCKEINCGISLRYFTNIRNGCIPTYYGEKSCCPIEWKCPEESHTTIPTENRSSADAVDPKSQCQYGKLSLEIGDEIKTDNECDVCKCITPPMAHCIQKPNY